MAKENNKATVQKLYDEIIPMIREITTATADLKNMESDIEDIKDDMKILWKSKISIKAFSTWLASTFIIIGAILTVLTIALR